MFSVQARGLFGSARVLLFALIVVALVASVASGQTYPYSTLQQAYDAAGFDPSAEGNFVFVATSDIHYIYTLPDEPLLAPMVNEMNAMSPLPQFFAVTGDLITYASASFGTIPTETEKNRARTELNALKRDLQPLNPQIQVKLALGNHDSYPYEDVENGLFKEVFPDQPIYGSFEVGGVHFVKLHGGAGGFIDVAQEKWLGADLAAIPNTRTVIAFVHQPSLNIVSAERGIGTTVKRTFADLEAEAWVLCGHGHANAEWTYKLPKTVVHQAEITRGTAGGWGVESPGYWIYCIKDAKVFARIFRRFDQGYRIDAPLPSTTTVAIPTAFDGRDDVITKLLVGETPGERDYLVKASGRDVVTWWYKVSDLTYRLPMTDLNGTPQRVGVLAWGTIAVQLSPDNVNWTSVSAVVDPPNGLHEFTIPANCISAEQLYVKVGYSGTNSTRIGGFAILGDTHAIVKNRRLFYNNSSLDQDNPSANAADDQAVDTVAQALLPGQTPAAVNVSNYICGINGVMIDIAYVSDAVNLGVNDFEFRIGETDDPSTWELAPVPERIVVRHGAGADGSDRVAITWANNAIRTTWLQVVVKATARTGLAGDDRFFFASLPGDANGDGTVELSDLSILAAKWSKFLYCPVDFDRSGRVDLTDLSCLSLWWKAELPMDIIFP